MGKEESSSPRRRWPWKSLLSHPAITCLPQHALNQHQVISGSSAVFPEVISHSPLMMSVILAAVGIGEALEIGLECKNESQTRGIKVATASVVQIISWCANGHL